MQNISREIISKVWEYIDENEDRIVEELKDLVRIPSLRGEAEPGMPFGRASAEAVEFSAKLFEKYGYSVERRGDRGYALAREGGGEKTLGVFCHCDVVRVDTGVWEQIEDPFEPELKDGYLIGRGVKDDKGAVIASLHALNGLKKAGVEIKNRVQVFLGGNEETGMEDIDNFKADQPMPDVSLVLDNNIPMCRGESSYTVFDLLCDRKFDRILDFFGGTNAGVCGEATVVLPNDPKLREELAAAVKDRGDARVEEKETGEPMLCTKGVTAHSAAPFQSINAGGIAAEILLGCPSLGENDLSVLRQLREMLSEVKGEYFNTAYRDEAFQDLTMVCCQIRMEEGRILLSCISNYSPAYPCEDLQKNMEARCGEIGWAFKLKKNVLGFLSEIDHPVIERVVAVYREVCAARNMEATGSVSVLKAATYARYLKNAFGSGFQVPGTVPPAYFTPGHGNAHQPDECISIRCFKEGILHLAMILADLDGELEHLPSARE